MGLLILAGALVGFVRLHREWKSADVSATWPRAAGMIESSSLTEQQRVGSGHRTWTVRLRYRYLADGKPQEGSVIHLGGFPSYDSEAEARAVQAHYAEGKTVEVAYNPAAPSTAVLEPGSAAAASSLRLGAVLLLVLLALGLTVVIQSVLRMRRAASGNLHARSPRGGA